MVYLTEKLILHFPVLKGGIVSEVGVGGFQDLSPQVTVEKALNPSYSLLNVVTH